VRALIFEHGRNRAALAGARALNAAGWEVGVASPDPVELAPSSRAVSRWHRVEPPEWGLEDSIRALGDAIAAGGYEVVLPADDAKLMALSLRRGDLHGAVRYPSHEVVVRALDKLLLAEAAGRAGLHPPITEAAGRDALPGHETLVVKPRLHAGFRREGVPAHWDALVATSRRAALEHAEELRAGGAEPVFQEHVRGGLAAFSAVAEREGRLVGRVQQASERIWPPGAGFSTRARTMPVDPALAERVAALLGELGWTGLAELQFIVDGEGRWRLLDLNGRLYGSLALAVAAGVNLPAAWAAVATGRPAPAAADARPGVRYQWLEGDLRRAARERSGGLAADLAGSFRYALGACHSIWRIDDPAPALRHAGRLARRGLAKPWRSRRSRG
jgi:predicted ATP-grasp superfamily ATP-dependent carboligase